jgi:hypothetical protein
VLANRPMGEVYYEAAPHSLPHSDVEGISRGKWKGSILYASIGFNMRGHTSCTCSFDTGHVFWDMCSVVCAVWAQHDSS